jgi:RNA-directed DNA polymerase
MKPGNSGGGKAVGPPWRAEGAPAVLRDGEAVELRLARIRRRARATPKQSFSNLFSHLDLELLRWAFERLKDGKAAGVDGVSVEEYGRDLERRLASLEERLHRGTYRPQPSRRRWIPKGDGRQRPLGIPTTEDKIVQGALAAILTEVYEEEFHDFSYGFRPGRGCHEALRGLARHIGQQRVNWVVEADIRGFFDNVSHEWLLRMVAHRVSDERVLRLIRRMLEAGVMEEGRRLATEKGTPQGGVISPLLANVYLHYALDEWFAKVVARRCAGEAYLTRYADDYAACFRYESEARWFRTALEERLGKFQLELEPTKTRVLRFGRFAKRDAERRGERPAVFDFLGFTHYCGTSRSGRFKLKWRTSKKRFRAKLHALREWIASHRTVPVAELWKTVNRKLTGHFAYYYVSDNWAMVREFRQRVLKALWWGLNRRSQRRSFGWQKFLAYVDRYPLTSPRQVVNLNPIPTRGRWWRGAGCAKGASPVLRGGGDPIVDVR